MGGLRDVIGDGNGQLLLAAWGPTANPGADDQLFHLNPATGATSLIGTVTDGVSKDYWVEGLAWVNGTLYASASAILLTNPPTYEGYAPDASNLLIKIDPATGHATEVGAFGPNFLNVQNLAYSPKYGLIGSDIGTLDPDPNQPNGVYSSFHTTPALIQIDPATGLAVKIADLPHGGLITNPYNSYHQPLRPVRGRARILARRLDALRVDHPDPLRRDVLRARHGRPGDRDPDPDRDDQRAFAARDRVRHRAGALRGRPARPRAALRRGAVSSLTRQAKGATTGA